MKKKEGVFDEAIGALSAAARDADRLADMMHLQDSVRTLERAKAKKYRAAIRVLKAAQNVQIGQTPFGREYYFEKGGEILIQAIRRAYERGKGK
jgi:hypothetical protein